MSHATYRPAEIEAIVRTTVTHLDDRLAAGEIDQDVYDLLQRVTAVWAERAYALLPTSRYAGKPANVRRGIDHLTGRAIPAAHAAAVIGRVAP